MLIARSCENRRAAETNRPLVASVTIKEGILSQTCSSPLTMPIKSPIPIATGNAAYPYAGKRTDRLNREVDTSQHHHEGRAGAEHEQNSGISNGYNKAPHVEKPRP